MRKRMFSIIAEVKSESRVAHYAGMPPEPTGGKDNRRRLPVANLVVVQATPDGVFLFRYTKDGEFSGDTWHRSVDEAIDQSHFEFGEALGEWTVIPEDVEDSLNFALSQIKSKQLREPTTSAIRI